MRFGDPDGVGGGGRSKAIEHILPSPPGQPAVDRLNRSSLILSVLIDPFDCASGALRVNPEQAPGFGLESRRVDFNK